MFHISGIARYRPKGVFGKGVGNSENASEMRQKGVKNASEMRQNGSCFIGTRGTSKMRQKSVLPLACVRSWKPWQARASQRSTTSEEQIDLPLWCAALENDWVDDKAGDNGPHGCNSGADNECSDGKVAAKSTIHDKQWSMWGAPTWRWLIKIPSTPKVLQYKKILARN